MEPLTRALLSILLGAALALPFSITAQQGAAASTPASRGYVDSKLCSGCHSAIYNAYARTGMGRSFSKPSASNRIEEYAKNNRFYHAASGTWFEMFMRDGEYFQRRYQIGYGGARTNLDETRVDYYLGSGDHARSYLHRTMDGRLVQLPVTWYAENGGGWAMSPGYDSRDMWYSQRGVSYECMFCHNSYPEVSAAFRRGDAQTYPAALPEGIDCQRCHGPGADHVRAAQATGARPEDLRKTIVNPARLTAERQLEICMQCHLETTSMNLPESITRFDRGPFSYAPTALGSLGDFKIFFDRVPGGGRNGPFEIAHSAYRLRQSQCFQKSGGGLTCTTCHDPHGSQGSQAGVKYNGACLQCHSAAIAQLVSNGKHVPDPNCVGCHMPKRRTDDVIHAVMTDHLIQRRPVAGDLLARRAERDTSDAAQYRGEVAPHYPDPLPKTAENELYVAIAQVRDKSNLAGGIRRLTAAIDAVKPRRPEPYFELAEALRAQKQGEKAIAEYREALRRDSNYLAALMGLGMAIDEMGRRAEGADVLRRATQVAPGDARTWNSLGAVEFRLSHAKEAETAFQKAIALDPEMPEPRNGIGLLLAQNGDRAGAAREFREAIRILPNYGNAHWNLGNFLAATGDLPQAAWELRVAADLLPAGAAVRFNYAVTLSGLEQFAEAELQVKAAIRLDNNLAEAHVLLGNLFEKKKLIEDARREYEAALRIRPGLSRAQLDLGTLLAVNGEVAAASQLLRNAAGSTDPAIRARAAEMLRKFGIHP